ncbi:MAG: hypothetical protein U0325_17520 [Polyangiales bacterium]
MTTRCHRCDTPLDPDASRCAACGAETDHTVTLARPPAPFASGDRVADAFTVLENQTTSPLGTVYRGRDDHGRAVSLRVLPESLFARAEEIDSFLAAVAGLTGRTLGRVAMPVGAGCHNGVVWVAAPWVFGTPLRDVLRAYRAAERRLERDQVLGVLQGVAAALRELHSVTAHGALLPDCVEVTADAIVLTAPGIAACAATQRLAACFANSPQALAYIAPEVRAGGRCNAAADLHALGALASELITGDPGRASEPGFSLPELGADLAEPIRALVSARPARRTAALPLLLERLARVAGTASLPSYAVLPRPAAVGEARTRRLAALVPGLHVSQIRPDVPAPIGPRTGRAKP